MDEEHTSEFPPGKPEYDSLQSGPTEGREDSGASTPSPEPGLLRRLAGGASWVAMAQMLPLVFNLALTPFVIHGLGVELYGIFLLVAVIQQFIGSVDGGVGPSTRRFFGIYSGRGDRASATALLVTLVALIAGAAAVISGLFIFAAPQIMAFFPGTFADPEGATFLLRVMIVLVAVAQLRGPFTQILMTANLFRVTAIGDLLGFFAYATGMVLTVQHGLGLAGVAWSFVAQQVMPTLLVLPQAMRRLDRRAVRFVPRSVLKEFFAYSWKLQISGTLTVLAAQGDALFVGRFAAPQMTAYGTGASFAMTLRNIPMNASLPMDASIVRAIGRHGPTGAWGEAARIQRLWVRLVAGWIAVGVPAAGFGVIAWLHLGTDLPGQVAAVVLLAHGITLLMLVQRYWLNGLGRSGLTLSYDVISTVVNLSLTFPLILSFGVLGTISATLIAAIVSAAYLTWVGQRRIGSPLPTPWSQVPWIDVIGASGLAAASCWAVATFVTGRVIPLGVLSLLTIGAAAAPALLLYQIRVVGFYRLRGMVTRVFSRRRR